MARTPFTPQDLQIIHDLAAQWGKIVARRAFDEQGPGTDIDLTTMEEVALAAAAGLTEGTLTTLLEQQAHLLGEQQACPACGRLCPLRRSLPCRHKPAQSKQALHRTRSWVEVGRRSR